MSLLWSEKQRHLPDSNKMKNKSAELGRLSAICFHRMENSFTGLLFIVWNIIRIEVSSPENSMHWEHTQNISLISEKLTEKKVEPKQLHPWSYFMVRNSAPPLALFWCHLQRCHFRGWSHFFPKLLYNQIPLSYKPCYQKNILQL